MKIKELDKNTKEALLRMFSFAGYYNKETLGEIETTEEGWFREYAWTEKDQELFIDWLAHYLIKNWEGIAERKPRDKKHAKEIAEAFCFNYGFPIKDLTIDDFTPIITWKVLENIMSKRQIKELNKYMFGQTCSPEGVYPWDLERFLKKQRVID